MVTPKASAEEVAKSLKAKVQPSKASAKAKAKTHAGKKERSPQKDNEKSPNPVPPKRVKGKQPQVELSETESQAKMIAELLEVWFYDFPSYIKILFLTSYICSSSIVCHEC